MNGCGKSDSLIVPEKPSNKAPSIIDTMTTGLRRWRRKGGWPRGICSMKQVPETKPGKVRTW